MIESNLRMISFDIIVLFRQLRLRLKLSVDRGVTNSPLHGSYSWAEPGKVRPQIGSPAKCGDLPTRKRLAPAYQMGWASVARVVLFAVGLTAAHSCCTCS